MASARLHGLDEKPEKFQHLNRFLFHDPAPRSRAHLEKPRLLIACAIRKKALRRRPAVTPRGLVQARRFGRRPGVTTVAFVHELLRAV